jgi:hypothetical protein
LSTPLRVIVTAALLVISLAALGQGTRLQDAVAQQLGNWWEEAQPLRQKLRPELERKLSAPSRPAVALAPAGDFVPLALLADGVVFALGRDGSVRSCPPECTAREYPVVTGVTVEEVPAEQGVGLQAKVDTGLVQKLLHSPLAADLSEICLAKETEIVLYTRDALKLQLERGPQLERDLRRLEAVLADLRARHVAAAAVDARTQGQIVVRPRFLQNRKQGFGDKVPNLR